MIRAILAFFAVIGFVYLVILWILVTDELEGWARFCWVLAPFVVVVGAVGYYVNGGWW